MRLLDIFEAFTDIGKLSDEFLSKGFSLSPEDEDNFVEVPGRIFRQVIVKLGRFDGLKESPRGLNTLSVYSVREYEQMQCFLGKNNTAGYCIKDGDELVSVFSTAGSSGNAIVADAVRRGVNRLDCFAKRAPDGTIYGPLVKLYERYGFRVDTTMNSGTPGEAYAIVRGVSSYVNDAGEVEPENPNVVVFMRR